MKCSRMIIRPCYKHRAHSVNMVEKKKKKGNGGWRGPEGAEWRGMSRSYLSIQKICWRWGSDRCPFHTLPHAAWFEKSRKEGRVTEQLHRTTSHAHAHGCTHTYSAIHTSPTVVKSQESKCFICFCDSLPGTPHRPSILSTRTYTHTHTEIQRRWMPKSEKKKRCIIPVIWNNSHAFKLPTYVVIKIMWGFWTVNEICVTNVQLFKQCWHEKWDHVCWLDGKVWGGLIMTMSLPTRMSRMRKMKGPQV